MAKYIQLYQVKKQLNIDEDFKDDDEYLVDLINVAEQMVENHIDDKLEEIAKANNNSLPMPLVHAMLLFIGNLYANRESIAFASSSETIIRSTNFDVKYGNESRLIEQTH